LQGELWFLGKIYGYPHEAIYFGIPLANFAGWAVGGFVYFFLPVVRAGPYVFDSVPRKVVSRELLQGLGLFYGVLAFNLCVTFWIGEIFMGMIGCFIVVPLTAALLATLWREDTYSAVHEMLK
jgi:uncharacterized membrane protein